MPDVANSTEVAKLTLDGKEIDVPVLEGTEAERGLDISTLRRDLSVITLDEGYVNTGSTSSAITFLNGEQGVLRYRGYPIEDLAQHCDFVECSYLLIYGDLPNSEQLEQFRMSIRRHTLLHEDMRSFYKRLPARCASHGHPVLGRQRAIDVLSGFTGSERSGPGGSVDSSADCEAADHCGVQLQKVIWSAVHLSKKRSYILREFLADDVCRSQRALCGRSGCCASVKHVADCSRRSRTKLQHLDRSHGWLVGCQLIRFDFCGDLCLMGALARWSE